ncbi:hypothetical protein FOA52_009879 [Chlamydomonas sp. UWO 241]|nr:hypothetical protein FOA52_009879 [Chlamydomonas sp. UWO 241]
MEEAELRCESIGRVTDEEGRAAEAVADMGAKLLEAAERGDADAVHMTKVMEVMCDGPQARRLLDDDQPDAVREECVRLLLLHGARFDSRSPVMVRVGRELASWAWRFAGSS